MSHKKAGAASAFSHRLAAFKRRAQVTVELLLVLPVFMLMLFFIMELGNIAYQVILLHHCAYELARIGSLMAGPTGASSGSSLAADCARANTKMQTALGQMRFKNIGLMYLDGQCVATGEDPQPASSPNPRRHINEDLEVTLAYPVQLVFPGSSYFLADNKRQGTRTVTVKVRMPIEKPVFQ